MKMIFKVPLSAALTIAVFSGVSMAHEWYASGNIAWMKSDDSDNRGAATRSYNSDFQGTDALGNPIYGQTVPETTALNFSSKNEDGYAISAEVGSRFDNGLRGSLELSFTNASVASHTLNEAASGFLNAEDATALIEEAPAAGVTIQEALSRDSGEVRNTAFLDNLYYDFNRDGKFQPYFGAGVGVTEAEVSYRPSGLEFVDDSETKFMWQGKVGATYRVNDKVDVFGEFTHRASDAIKVDVDTAPIALKVDNEQNMLGIGLRYRFN